MKTRKTRTDERATYTYMGCDGRKVVLKVGMVSPMDGRIITEEDIRILHRMDDNEVYNNVKNAGVPIQPWEKPSYEEWMRNHPGEEVPSRGNISLDEAVDDMDSDKGSILYEASLIVGMEEEDLMKEKLYEAVEKLTPEQKELFRKMIIEEEETKTVAAEYEIEESAIRHRMRTIRKAIRRNI